MKTALEYFFSPGGPFAWRCLLALEAKQLDYAARVMDLSKGEHKTPEFLKINPKGMLPVLRHGDVVVRESLAILFYVDRAFPERPLFGRTAAEAGLVMQEICEQCDGIQPTLVGIIGPVLYSKAADKLAKIGDAAAPLLEQLENFNQRLEKNPWLAGDQISAADVNIYPFFPTLERALKEPEAAPLQDALGGFASNYPGITRWRNAIEDLRGHDRTTPEYWKKS
jgi:glutathione S-transferase